MSNRAQLAALFGCIAAILALTLLRVLHDRPFLSQPGALAFPVRLITIAIVYAALLGWIFLAPWFSRQRSSAWSFGLLGAGLEMISIVVENVWTAGAVSKGLTAFCLLAMFAIWGIAGFRVSRAARAIAPGTTTSIVTAMVCMTLSVPVGMFVEFYALSADPAYVRQWAEFKRSGWTDPGLFAVANTFDSAFTHFLLAPIVGSVLGTIGAVIGLVLINRTPSAGES